MLNRTHKKIGYWSNQEIALLRKLYPKVLVRNLVKFFPKRNRATIVAKALNLKLPSAKLWQPEENNILHKYFTEASMEELRKLLPKRSRLAILAQGERLGLKRQTNKPHLRINEFYFKKWSPNMAYLLGFIFADGSIIKEPRKGESDKLSFGLNRRDIDILEKIKYALSSAHSLSLVGNYVYLSIQSQKIVDDLKKLGISYRKSFREGQRKTFQIIPPRYVRDFIRGIVDGDGSINFDKKWYPTLSVCGKKNIITFIRNHFLFRFNIYSKIAQAKYYGKKYNLFYVAYRANSAKTLINYLYNNAGLYLERKFKLAKQCLKITIKHRGKQNIS